MCGVYETVEDLPESVVRRVGQLHMALWQVRELLEQVQVGQLGNVDRSIVLITQVLEGGLDVQVQP